MACGLLLQLIMLDPQSHRYHVGVRFTFCGFIAKLALDHPPMVVLLCYTPKLFSHDIQGQLKAENSPYTPYSKMAANELFFCLHVN